jgi:hypothetical protein
VDTFQYEARRRVIEPGGGLSIGRGRQQRTQAPQDGPQDTQSDEVQGLDPTSRHDSSRINVDCIYRAHLTPPGDTSLVLHNAVAKCDAIVMSMSDTLLVLNSQYPKRKRLPAILLRFVNFSPFHQRIVQQFLR